MTKNKNITPKAPSNPKDKTIVLIKGITTQIIHRIYCINEDTDNSEEKYQIPITEQTLSYHSAKFHTLILYHQTSMHLIENFTVDEILLACLYLSLKINNIDISQQLYTKLTSFFISYTLELKIMEHINFMLNITDIVHILYRIVGDDPTPYELAENILSTAKSIRIGFFDPQLISPEDFVLTLLSDKQMVAYENTMALKLERDKIAEYKNELNAPNSPYP